MMLKAIIVDDKPAARRLLNHLCQEQGNIEVIGEAANGTSAIEVINQLQPDVVFLDIQMPEITGLQVLENLAFQPNVIFTTAYDHFALQAFESFAVDYLLKPIKDERFFAAIQKLEKFRKINNQINVEELQKLIVELKPKQQPKALPVKTGDKILLIDFDSIAYLEANDKYVNLYTTNDKKYLVDFTLSHLEEKLPQQLLRVQKSYIINKAHIKEVYKHFNGRFVLILKDIGGSRITTGLTFYDSVKSGLGL